MNPPSVLHGAMNRDRKPFTYTPGGLDLSEIKSERMAKRLMRNAMNEGVPQQPVQPIQSPPASTIAVPNFNCLPVQVFPAFNLPANPKSLLRTRSNPVSREPPLQRVAPPQFVNNKAPVQYDTFNKNTPPYSQINNNRPTSMFEYGAPAGSPLMNYGKDAYNATFPGNNTYNTEFPEISYDAQYFQAPKTNKYVENTLPPVTIKNDVDNDYNAIAKTEEDPLKSSTNNVQSDIQSKIDEFYSVPAYENKESVIEIEPEITTPVLDAIIVPEIQNQEDLGYKDEQKEVKIVTKESKKETKTEAQNGDQNGDTEAVMTVKLPTKKSAAKTETKVEISQKSLPDSSIEEVKKTITKTTIDGKTEIKTKTETTIIPKEDEEEEEIEEEEEEEAENGEVVVTEVDDQESIKKPITTVVKSAEETSTQVRENGQDNIIKTEKRSETTTTSTKKVVVVQNDDDDEEEAEIEEEETEEAEPVKVILKKTPEPLPLQDQVEDKEDIEVEKKIELKEQEPNKKIENEPKVEEPTKNIDNIQAKEENKEEEEEGEEVEEEEEYEEAEEKHVEIQAKTEPAHVEQIEGDESEYTDEEVEPQKEVISEKVVEETKVSEKIVEEAKVSEKVVEETKVSVEETKVPVTENEVSSAKIEAPSEKPVEIEIPIQKDFDDKQEVILEKQNEEKQEVTEETKTEKLQTSEPKVPLREPSVPLEKVEDVEIKPIGAGNFVTKTRTETTEIITGAGDKPTGLLTEYNRTENIVTVNRTTKTLDYENAPTQAIPTLTYFTPHIEKFPPSPQPASRPYQPVYPSEPTSERRHSLLLERLSMERQIPTNEIYQNTQQFTQSTEQQNQWSQEPRVEILNIENVKPSSITNQQWYQQTDKKDLTYNNVAPVAPSWTQPKPQQQPAYQPPSQPTYQPPPQPAYQPQSQPTYQAQHQPKPAYQPTQPQSAYQPQQQYQPQPVIQPQTQPQYQSTYTDNIQQNSSSQQSTYSSQQNYSTYTPKPSNWDTPRINEPTQYSLDSYQNPQQRTSYVPPPWEQDSTYVVDNSQNYYQPPQNTFTSDINQDWKPNPPTPKFTKTTPTAYIPPKPNQSFVKHVTIAEPPKQPGRKTYYSEYERRYISVPESTYIPGENKLPPQQSQPQQNQPQPDPSPAYYYDNNEPAEAVEHQWRKELREFTEKAQTQPENVKPPWETSIESKTQTQYAKTQDTTYTATPTWSQTLRPQSWRERSFESEFVSQEWPKTNTIGRGRPLSSSFGRETSTIPERTRGVSVDRYNPNNYQAPVPEPHPPVQTFTHNPPAPHATGYHNPNVPAYHVARASAEPREQPVYQQPRARVDSRASPFQSRSFKYLQWITGTDD